MWLLCQHWDTQMDPDSPLLKMFHDRELITSTTTMKLDKRCRREGGRPLASAGAYLLCQERLAGFVS